MLVVYLWLMHVKIVQDECLQVLPLTDLAVGLLII